jgi:CIC family chloride channel protein
VKRFLSADLIPTVGSSERRLVVKAVVIGAVVWLIVYLLRLIIHDTFVLALQLAERSPALLLIFVPLLAGAALTATAVWYDHSYIHFRDRHGRLHRLIDAEGDGMERAIALYYSSEPAFEQAILGKEGVDVRWELPTLSLTLRKWLATWFTLGFGGSGGLEGSVGLIGESLAAGLFKPRALRLGRVPSRFWQWWKSPTPDDLQTAQLCGIAAALCTLLGAPFASAFFAVEVVYRRRPVVEKLIFALIAALVAFFLSHFTTAGHSHIFEPGRTLAPPVAWRYYAAVFVLCVALALISKFFAVLRRRASLFFHIAFPNIWLRHTLGAAGAGLIALAAHRITGAGLGLTLSTGQEAVNAALAGQLTVGVAFVALVAKLLATTSTVGSGGSAGLLIPAMFVGAMTGVVCAGLLGYDPLLLIVPAITASLVSMINVPLAAIMLTVEIFGAPYILPSLLALIVALLFSQGANVYRTQRDEDTSREIMPGYVIRRVAVPPAWESASLADLGLRSRFEVTVVGLVETPGQHSLIRLDVPAIQPLRHDDLLIVLGKEEAVNGLIAFIQEEMVESSE